MRPSRQKARRVIFKVFYLASILYPRRAVPVQEAWKDHGTMQALAGCRRHFWAAVLNYPDFIAVLYAYKYGVVENRPA